jgi:hypothetical protein
MSNRLTDGRYMHSKKPHRSDSMRNLFSQWKYKLKHTVLTLKFVYASP